MDNMRISVIGLGYIGLPTAAVLASQGFDVVGVDTKQQVVDAVNAGQVPFVEPDLDVSVAGAVSRGWLRAQSTIPASDVFIIAVPTPFSHDRLPDLSYVEAAASSIATVLTGGELVILESTSPPGTTRRIAELVSTLRPDIEVALNDQHSERAVHFAHCPERVLPGRIMIEMIQNDRIVGGLSGASTIRAAALYNTFCKGQLLTTNATTAETAKLVENAYRDVNIALANEIAKVADSLGIDGWELIDLANHHPRVNILKPGPGVGGHCIAVDPWFLISAAPDETLLMRQARQINDSKPAEVTGTIRSMVIDSGARSVTVMGLAYKPDIDDLRESPAVAIVGELAETMPDLAISVVEPHVKALPQKLAAFQNVTLGSVESAKTEAGVVCVLVEHTAFRAYCREDFAALRILDTCGLWSKQAASAPIAAVQAN
ncbi:UDP-N-acetyl-D-mannosamine dehydrogenase [Pseudarthrobacter sp. J1738]|uniref:UDP-N-acetyl-D-mannosamine dehydrogenase n=1 Tax=Pseudarthrobacter sp. J1738 TaxID=3420446 RepID=UPI003D2AEE53